MGIKSSNENVTMSWVIKYTNVIYLVYEVWVYKNI